MNLSNFNLRNLRQRDIALIIIAVSILAGLLWYFYRYQPAGERIVELRSEISGLESDIATGERARDNIEALEAELESSQEARRAFLAELPRESEVANLLDQLRLGAQATEVTFESVNQSGNTTEQIQDVRPIGFSVTTQGNYPNTMSFLDILESLRRFTKVRQVSLNIEEEGISNPPLNASFDFTVYVYTGTDVGDTQP